MSEILASVRDSVGVQSSLNALRGDKCIPAVLYGAGYDKSIPLSVPGNQIVSLFNSGYMTTSVIDLNINDKIYKVLIKDVQWHSVTDKPLHADFLDLSACVKVKVQVPIIFTNIENTVALKRGGALKKMCYDILIECPKDNIPKSFEIDVSLLSIGKAFRIRDLEIPEGTKVCAKDHSVAIVKVSGSRKKVATDGEEATEGEKTEDTASDTE